MAFNFSLYSTLLLGEERTLRYSERNTLLLPITEAFNDMFPSALKDDIDEI